MNTQEYYVYHNLKLRNITVGTILRKKLRKYFNYYIIVGMIFDTELKAYNVVGYKFHKEIPNNEILRRIMTTKPLLENQVKFTLDVSKVNESFEIYSKVSYGLQAILEGNIGLSRFSSDYFAVVNYAEILVNKHIGEVIHSGDHRYDIIINENPYSILRFNSFIKYDTLQNLLKAIVNSKDKITEITLYDFSRYCYDARYIGTIDKSEIVPFVEKLRLVDKL